MLRYITYSKEEEAVRCIQNVHGFLLDGRSLRYMLVYSYLILFVMHDFAAYRCQYDNPL